MYLTLLQIDWLHKHGDRTEWDVEIDDNDKLYVEMYNPNRTNLVEKVFLPDQHISLSEMRDSQ